MAESSIFQRIRSRVAPGPTVLVVGLGRFGSSLALTLEDLGHDVIAIDFDPALVAEYRDLLSETIEADATSSEALRQVGATEVHHAIVAIGAHMEASILATSALVDLGVPDVWAKALSEAHGRILERVGAHHVVLPEAEMGRRVAHLVTGQALDYMEVDDGFALVETTAPKEMVGRTIGDAEIRGRYNVTVVCVKPPGGAFTYATAEQLIDPDAILIVAGSTRDVDRFAELA